MVQLSETNPFGRCISDKVIEITVKKNTETPGWLISLLTSSLVDMELTNLTEGFVSLPAFTDFVTVSAFTELGKTKAFRKMAKNVEREEVLENLGEECYLDKDMF